MSMHLSSPVPIGTAIREARRAAAAIMAALTVILIAMVAGGAMAPTGAVLAAVLLVAVIGGIDRRGIVHHPCPGFGRGNRITLGRAALVCALAGRALDPSPLRHGEPLAIAITATIVFLLDGLDGWAARRERLTSRFGARFDIETDAALVAVLAVAAVRQGLPVWVLTIGALRYLYVAAARVLAWPPSALPETAITRWRRKAIGALQVVALIAALVAIPGRTGTALCAVALALLLYSFGADLALRRGAAQAGSGAERPFAAGSYAHRGLAWRRRRPNMQRNER